MSIKAVVSSFKKSTQTTSLLARSSFRVRLPHPSKNVPLDNQEEMFSQVHHQQVASLLQAKGCVSRASPSNQARQHLAPPLQQTQRRFRLQRQHQQQSPNNLQLQKRNLPQVSALALCKVCLGLPVAQIRQEVHWRAHSQGSQAANPNQSQPQHLSRNNMS